jgi:hypothetical protein
MKNNFLKNIVILAIPLIVSCSKSTLDVNTDPNNPTATGPELVLPTCLTNIAGGQITGYNYVNEWMGYWCPSGSYAISASDLASYKQTTEFGNNLWINAYHLLSDLNYIITSSKSQNKSFYQAAGLVINAYTMQQMVDNFNNVPYSEAFKGTATIQPKYDNAQSIYESITNDLTLAVTLFSRSDAKADANTDVLFSGDNTKWMQFANTLKLRILTRQSEMSGRDGYIKAQIDSINANGKGFLTTDASVNPGYLNTSGKMNPFWALNYNVGGTYINDFWRANQYPITFCMNNNDPRYQLWYAPSAKEQVYQGNIIGSATNHAGNSASVFGPGVLKNFSQGAVILSASESNFLQAEAILRGWMTGNAQALFESGVAASFNYLGAGNSTAYVAQSGNKNTNYAACNSFNEKLACIIRQKWEANNNVTPFEAWCDYRRLNLPADIPISVSPYIDVAAIPYRILYPTIEYQTNATNVNDQGTIDHHTSKIFWMK